MANRINNWQELLKLANDELKKHDCKIRVVLDVVDGGYDVDIYKGVECFPFASNYFEDELSDCINDAWAHARNKMANDADYWPFIEANHPNYYHSQRIAEIDDIEKELENYGDIPEQEFNDLRHELRRLTLKCFDEALCNHINKKWPGAVTIMPRL